MAEELLLPVVTEENACLPLSINAVARYWNVDIPLPPTDSYPADSGSILIEGMEAAERHGLASSVVHTDVAGLEAAMDRGIPPIVMLPGIGGLTHHLSVITGYDNDSIIHYVPKSSGEGVYEGAIPRDVFDAKWSQDGRVAVLVGPPDRVKAGSRSLRMCMEAERASLLGRRSRAEDMLNAAIREDPSDSTAWLLLAGIQNSSGRDECVNSYTKCIRLNGLCYLAYRGLGNYYLKKGDEARAEESYTSAIGIDAERSGSVYKNRAYLRERRRAYAEAARDLAEYVRLSPGAPDRGAMERAVAELASMK